MFSLIGKTAIFLKGIGKKDEVHKNENLLFMLIE